MILFTPVILKDMKKNLDITNLVVENKFCKSFGPSLSRGSSAVVKII